MYNTIQNKDCITAMEELYIKYGECIDLCVTDPPYGISYLSNGSRNKKDKIHNDNIVDYGTFGQLVYKLLKNNSHAYFFTRFDVYPEHYQQLKKIGFNIKSLLIGEKLQAGGLGDLKGSYVNNVELIIFAHKGRRVFNETKLKKNSKVSGKKLNRYSNVTSEYKKRFPCLWKIDEGYPPVVENSSKNKRNPHPTPKSSEYLEWLIQLSSNEGDVVLDPFMGSGSLAEACIRTNRKYIGYEIDSKFYNYSLNRISGIKLKG